MIADRYSSSIFIGDSHLVLFFWFPLLLLRIRFSLSFLFRSTSRRRPIAVTGSTGLDFFLFVSYELPLRCIRLEQATKLARLLCSECATREKEMNLAGSHVTHQTRKTFIMSLLL